MGPPYFFTAGYGISQKKRNYRHNTHYRQLRGGALSRAVPGTVHARLDGGHEICRSVLLHGFRMVSFHAR